MKLSIIVPAHNEEDNIVDVIEKMESSLKFDHELIIINDHSTDQTANKASSLCSRYPHLKVLDNAGGRGFAAALKYGFNKAEGELILPVMGDLCDDLATIGKMIGKIKEGYDVVCGCRYINGGARIGGSRLKSFLSSSAGWSLFYLLGIPTHDAANAFKMYKKEVIRAIDIESCGFEVSLELPLKAYYLGFKIAEVPTVWRERTRGKSNFKILKLIPGYLKLYFWGIKKRLFK